MSTMSRSWRDLYQIYGSDERDSNINLSAQGIVLGFSTGAFVIYFNALTIYLTRSFPLLPVQVWSLLVGFVVGLTALMCVCFLVTAANLLYSSLILRWRIAEQMLDMLDWSYVHEVLDVGCGSGILLNAVGLRLKKERAGGGCAVGVDLWLEGGKKSMSFTLQNASLEIVDEYVTCKTGEPRNLPFEDDHFDAVVSAMCLHKLSSESGPRSAEACEERLKGLQEIVRVLKPGGKAVIWDLCHVNEYAVKLKDLHMSDVKVSSCIPAYMMQSHIVSFKKPGQMS